MGSCSRASRGNNLSFSQHTGARIWKNASIYWREKFLRWRIRRHRIWTFWEVLWNTSRWVWFLLFDMEGLYQIEWASQCLGSFEFEKLLYWIWTSLGTTNRKVRRNSNWTFFYVSVTVRPLPNDLIVRSDVKCVISFDGYLTICAFKKLLFLLGVCHVYFKENQLYTHSVEYQKNKLTWRCNIFSDRAKFSSTLKNIRRFLAVGVIFLLPCVSREKQFSVLIFTVEYVLVRILEFCHITVKFSKWLKEIGRSQPTQRLHFYPDFDR